MRQMWCANEGRGQTPLGDEQEDEQTKCIAKAKGGEEDTCIKVLGMCSGLTPAWEVDGANGPQEADAAAAPELEVPVPGTVQHFSSKEQEEVKVFLSLHCISGGCQMRQGTKGWHAAHLTTSGPRRAAVLAITRSCYRLALPYGVFWLESLLSYFPVSHNLCNISKCYLWS